MLQLLLIMLFLIRTCFPQDCPSFPQDCWALTQLHYLLEGEARPPPSHPFISQISYEFKKSSRGLPHILPVATLLPSLLMYPKSKILCRNLPGAQSPAPY